jgi:hypothetical protein
VAQCLQLESFHEEEMVFDHGEIGEKFYIIVSGQVAVDIPVKIEVSPTEIEKRW